MGKKRYKEKFASREDCWSKQVAVLRLSKLFYNVIYILEYMRATKFVNFVSFLEKSPCLKLGRCIFIGIFRKTCHSGHLLTC